MKNVCVIGGSGFVGTRLICRLEQAGNYQITNLDKVSSRRYPGLTRLADVRSVQSLASIPDGAAIVNLAAEHRDDVRPVSLYHDVNAQGAANICEAARHRGCTTIVFTSSVAVYGFADIGTDEAGPIAPFNEYGKTKYEAEQILRA